MSSHRKSSKLESKLIRYALAGGAVLGAPVAANAGVVYSGVINSAIGGNSSLDVTFDGALTTLTLNTSAAAALSYVSVSGPGTTSFVSNGSGPQSLTLNTLIDAANAIGPGGDLVRSYTDAGVNFKTGNWAAQSQGYLGVRFEIAGAPHYGWAQLNGVSACGQSLPTCPFANATLVDYAYEDQANVGILAGDTGAVPEPSSLALFALGAAGLLAVRRKRQHA